MLKRMEVFFIASMFILITTVILVVYTMQREEEFTSHHSDIQFAVVQGAAYAVNNQLQNKRQHIRLFLDEYSELFKSLNATPDDTKISKNIIKRLDQRFSDFFTYTVTDQKGVPLVYEIDSLVGDACQSDLDSYASKMKWKDVELNNEVFVHPQAFNYHYDIMSPLKIDGLKPRIFFSSFYLSEIARILESHEVPGVRLFLTKQSSPTLIEVSKAGARDTLKRDINLSYEERSRIIAYQEILESDWRLVALPDADMLNNYISDLWDEVIIVLFVVTLALYVLIVFMFRLTGNK